MNSCKNGVIRLINSPNARILLNLTHFSSIKLDLNTIAQSTLECTPIGESDKKVVTLEFNSQTDANIVLNDFNQSLIDYYKCKQNICACYDRKKL